MFTILVGRFVGPTLRWCQWWRECWICRWQNSLREYYRLPAVATVLLPAWDSGGAAIDIPAGMQSGEFKWLLLGRRYFCGLVAGCAGGYGAAVSNRSFKSLFVARPFVVADAVISAIGVVALVVLIRHPLMPGISIFCVKWLGFRGLSCAGC